MNIRMPIADGSFYESSADSCRRHVEKLLAAAAPQDLPGRLYGGVVPHAGWTFSGRLAAQTFKALHACRPLESVVLLGTDHGRLARRGEVYDSGVWRTPLGEAAVDEELAGALLADEAELFSANLGAHEGEHSIEVQLPLLQALAPEARIVPISVPPAELAVEIGRRLGKVLAERGAPAVVVASTDLTHHGGRFGAPGGRGEKGVRWTEANDRRMIQLIESMDAEGVVPEWESRYNACGPGAIAAAVAACREMGAARGVLLEYTNSYRVIRKLAPYELDETAVGYAAMVFA